MRQILSLLLLVPLLGSCFVSRATVNEPLGSARLAKLEPGVTTAAEAVRWLGAPNEVVQLGRRSAYRFDAQANKRSGLWLVVVALFNDDTREDRIWTFFDENDVLTHVAATLTFDDARYGMPWNSIHDDEPNE